MLKTLIRAMETCTRLRKSNDISDIVLKSLRWWFLLATISSVTTVSSVYYSQPNIVFIMVDDMGWNDVSFHGSDQILTPNIDTLAHQGIVLQQYYSEAICTPARSALLTGKYPMRLGMHGLPLYNGEDRGIPVTERLLPSYLKQLGYSTHLVGKWHVGMSRQAYLPTNRGYDTHYGIRGGFIDYYTHDKIETWPNGRTVFGLDLFDNDIPQKNQERHAVDALTDRAVHIIQTQNTSRPMFLHLAYNTPHAGNDGSSLQPPLDRPVLNRHIANSNRRLYAEMVNQLDESVGRVIRALADKQILDQTIIVFQSDNGAPTTGQFANWGVNLPFRGKKYTPWEGGVRVPAIVWHSSFRPRVWQGLMHITDWLPTLVAAAGGTLTAQIDGVNQWDSIINDRESPRKEVLIAIENEIGYAAYRAGDYKIVVGNVTPTISGFYGAEFLANKRKTPDYFPALKNCDASKAMETLGLYMDFDEVQAMRKATAVKQIDQVRDSTLCVPTYSKGCLYNIRRDPAEMHDLWWVATNIASLLTARLRTLWAQQAVRGPIAIEDASDPARFQYVWTPWIDSNGVLSDYTYDLNKVIEEQFRDGSYADTNATSEVDCNSKQGLTNFVCLLNTVF